MLFLTIYDFILWLRRFGCYRDVRGNGLFVLRFLIEKMYECIAGMSDMWLDDSFQVSPRLFSPKAKN